MSIIGYFTLDVKRCTPKDCVRLFEKAEKSISIILPVSGASIFWNNAVFKALGKAVVRGVAVRVAYCPPFDMGKASILSVPGIATFQLEKPHKRFLVSVDGKHVICPRPQKNKGNISLICLNTRCALAHEIETEIDEIIRKKGS